MVLKRTSPRQQRSNTHLCKSNESKAASLRDHFPLTLPSMNTKQYFPNTLDFLYSLVFSTELSWIQHEANETMQNDRMRSSWKCPILQLCWSSACRQIVCSSDGYVFNVRSQLVFNCVATKKSRHLHKANCQRLKFEYYYVDVAENPYMFTVALFMW